MPTQHTPDTLNHCLSPLPCAWYAHNGEDKRKKLNKKKKILPKSSMFSLEIELIAQPQARIGIGDERGIKHSGIISARNCRGIEKRPRKKTGKN
jgi:hypothetical protein